MRRPQTARSPVADARRFALLLTGAYLVVAGIGMWRHEMWRDEMEVLATIRAHSLAGALAQLVDSNVYFYALLAWVKLCGGSARAFQLFHLLAAGGALYLFARHSPFGRGAKLLFAFGYYPLFEYGVISRDYSFASLLLWAAVASLASERRRPVLTAGLLLLLANHGLFGAFAAAGLAAYATLDFVARARNGGVEAAERRRLPWALALLAAGAVLLAAQYHELAASRSAQVGSVERASPGTTLRAVWNAYVPLPDFSAAHFWNTNLVPFQPVPTPDRAVELTPAHVFAVAASLVLIAAALVLFARCPPVLAAWVVTTGLDLAFLHYLSVLYMRYTGFLFLALMSCAWLLAARAPGRRRRAGLRAMLAGPGLAALLATQLVAGAFFWVKDVALPFTAADAAADWIREQGLDRRTTIGFVDYVAAPVAARLGRPFYFAESGSFGTYVDWRAPRREIVPFEEVLAEGVRMLREQGEPPLFVLSFEIKSFDGGPLPSLVVEPGIALTRLAAFEEGIVPDEYYYLYELHRQTP